MNPISLIVAALLGHWADGKLRMHIPLLGRHPFRHVSFKICEQDKLDACVVEKARVDQIAVSSPTETAAHGGVKYYTLIRAVGKLTKCRIQYINPARGRAIYWCDSREEERGRPTITLHKGNLLVFIPGRDKDTGEVRTFTARLGLLGEASLEKGKDLELNYAIDLRNCEVTSAEELHCQEPIPHSIRIESGFTGADQNVV